MKEQQFKKLTESIGRLEESEATDMNEAMRGAFSDAQPVIAIKLKVDGGTRTYNSAVGPAKLITAKAAELYCNELFIDSKKYALVYEKMYPKVLKKCEDMLK